MIEDKQLEAAAEKYGNDNYEIVRNVHEYNNDNDLTNGFVDGAKSDAAKQYWYKQFQLEHKQAGAGVCGVDCGCTSPEQCPFPTKQQSISIEDISAMAEKEYDAEFDGYDGDVRRIYDNAPATKSIAKDAWVKVFIKGFTSALQYSTSDNWISVSERLPEDKQKVVVVQNPETTATRDSLYAEYDAKNKKFINPSFSHDGIHLGVASWADIILWQPLPKPPNK